MKNNFITSLKLATLIICASSLSFTAPSQSFAATLPTTLLAEEQQDSGWEFDKETKTLRIKKNLYVYSCSEAGYKFLGDAPWSSYSEDIEKVIIDKKVKVLRNAIFSNLPNLKEIKIPSSVTKIEDYVFYNCTSLESIEIPNSTTSIGFEAFFNCKNLKEITIGSKVKSIGKNAFGGCTSLKTIKLSPNNLSFKIHKGILYNKNMKKLLLVPKNTVNSVTIPNSVQIIDSFAFADCKTLKNIVIPLNVKEISEGAFYNCVNLNSIEFAKKSKCKTIVDFSKYYGDEYDERYGTFENCRSLVSLTFPDSIETLDYNTLNNCSSLIQISFGSKFISAQDMGYKGLSKLTTIKVSSKNKTYSSSNGILFNKAKTELLWYPPNKPGKTYIIPAKIKIIRYSGFRYNKNLLNLNLSSVEKIYPHTFLECAKLKTVKWSKKLKYIGWEAFLSCEKLESFVSYGNYLKIEQFAFCDCSSLSKITLKSGTNYIDTYAFYGCSFKKVTIPASVKRLGFYSFGYHEVGNRSEGIKDFTIYCKKNSVAHKYAKREKFKYKYY